MKKVLIITYYWPPSGGASVQRWLKLTKYLLRNNIEPIVLTVDEKSASYPVQDKTFYDEVDDRIKVYRTKSFEILKVFSFFMGEKKVPYGGFSNVNTKTLFSKITRFLRGNLFIPDARVGWNSYAIKKAIEIIKEHNIDTVISTSPPHSSQLIGMKLKEKLNVNWILDINDPWTDIYYYKDLYHLDFVKKIDKKYESAVINKADRIIANCISNKQLYKSKLDDASSDKFIVVSNGYDGEDFPEDKPVNKTEFVFTYTGTITEKYEPDILFDSINKIRDFHKDVSFKLVFVGTVSPSIKLDIEKYKIDDITEYVGHVSHKKAIDFAINSTVLINVFPKTTLDKGVPGKLGEYLAAQKPIISIGPSDGDSAGIVMHTNAGRSFEREMGSDLFAFLKELVDKWKTDPHNILEANENVYMYSWKYGAGQIAKLINEISSSKV